MQILIQVSRDLWGKVKNFATVKDLTLPSAVDQLLRQGLVDNGFVKEEHVE
jgi:hypothetical protein